MSLDGRSSNQVIRDFILKHVIQHSSDIVSFTAKKFNISRQAVHKHLQPLIEDGYLTSLGKTRKVYKLGKFGDRTKIYGISKDLHEDLLWVDFKDLFEDLPKHIEEICYFGFTEMVNNAIDHSKGNRVAIKMNRTPKEITIRIADDGEGIFKKIKRECKLADERLALLELAKGKLTTDPKHHTGEGIFFTSRAFDDFMMSSGNLVFSHSDSDPIEWQDWLLEDEIDKHGTDIIMRIDKNHKKTIKEIFDEFAPENNDYSFSKTIVPVKLVQFEQEGLISRSQGKRLVARFEKFKYVILDFAEVNQIGQAFADEVFRVFTEAHPEVKLTYRNTNKEVEAFLKRAKSHHS